MPHVSEVVSPDAQRAAPRVSVIINTDGRAGPLRTCLESLRYLRYPNFEVVVVAGPTRDGTQELCAAYGTQIHYADCPVRNLSMSRNISIHISSGEFVAFLDDDSVPEPEWLDDVMPAFADSEVAVAGGFLHDHTGKAYQWTFGTVDRFGVADTTWNRATPELNFPLSFHYPHVMANSVFRRSAIVEVGGFDEEYEYFLDESDLIVRFVDAGWKVAQLDVGFVHHKFMPSHLRNESRVLTSWYSVLKNKTYFALLNGGGHTSAADVVRAANDMVAEFRVHVQWAVEERLLEAERMPAFELEVDQALRDGLARGLAARRRLVPRAALRGSDDFRRFVPHRLAADQHCHLFLSRTYPPGSIGGIGRFVHHLAREVAARGHQVHVLTEGSGHDRVDFEDGVWVHRIVVRDFERPTGIEVPERLWNYSRTMLAEAITISDRRPVRSVSAPIWDLEGIAFLESGRYPLFVLLQTTMAVYLDSNGDKRDDDAFMTTFASPVLEAERRLVVEADGVIAHSEAIADEVERLYGVVIAPEKRAVVHLGLDDWTGLASEVPAADERTRICFVGRLEARKGADVFLAIVPTILAGHPDVRIDIVGNDRIPFENGAPLRQRFDEAHPDLRTSPRLRFHGEVSEERLRGFYEAADVVVAPSRFESFGLVHLEAMMHGKPVVGGRAGGMQEVVDDEVTGVLVEPGSEASLLAAIEALLADPARRRALGQAGRESYLRRFTSRMMADNTLFAIEARLSGSTA